VLARGGAQAHAQQHLHPAALEHLLRGEAQALRHLGQHRLLRVHQLEAHLGGLDAGEVLEGAGDQLAQLSHRLHAREAAAGHHEGEERLLGLGVGLDVRQLQAAHHVVAQAHRIGHVFHRQRVLGDAGHVAEVGDLAQAEDEVIVRHRHQLEALAL
jgi:hypothetical protein